MPPAQNVPPSVPPQVAAIVGVIWLLFMAGVATSYVIMLVALWKGMRAHQKIAEALNQIADKLQAK